MKLVVGATGMPRKPPNVLTNAVPVVMTATGLKMSPVLDSV